ncbi:hypothetical protein ABIB62_000863 [Mucilaginibacter sp. UYP25]|uniref:PLDc N-terminal domain-containing protein n=1 Tax=unclassified Mucilaginibacter TaxID=2617802 RepID=UPI003396E0F9
MGGFGTTELIIIFMILCYFGLIVFALIDALRSTFQDSVTKLIWVLVILFFPFLGSIIYFVVGRNSKVI